MGMRQLNVNMNTTVNRLKLLERLKENRKKHSAIVEEAQAGYLVFAIKKANEALAALKEKKMVSLQSFTLQLPEDYTSAYDTVIQMLEWSTDEVITLGADEFRQLVEDRWDWREGFYARNAFYSQTAANDRE